MQNISKDNLNIKLLDRQKDKKIKYLQDQNQAMRDQIKDLQENLRINKESLDLLIKKLPSPSNANRNPNKNILPNENLVIEETNDTAQRGILQKIIDNLMLENQTHLLNINRLINDRNNAQAKAFVNELICDETQMSENELIGEMRDRIIFLQKILNQKEKEEAKTCEKTVEDIIVWKSIIENPNEQMMKLYQDLQATKNALSLIHRKYIRLKTEQKDLISLNYNLFQELNKLKEEKSEIIKHESYTNISILTYYKEFLKETGDQSNDEYELSPLNCPYSAKIHAPKLVNKQSYVPKLDLTKAKQIQENNAKRLIQNNNKKSLINEEDLALMNSNFFEKIKKFNFKILENDLIRVKKLLHFEMVEHNRLQEECQKASFEKNQLKEEMERFKASQKDYEKKWEKIQKYLKFYRDFYFKNIFPRYQNKKNHDENQKFGDQNDQIIGIETIQNRLNKTKDEKPSVLADISLNMLETEFFKDVTNKYEGFEHLKENKETNRSKSYSFPEIFPLESAHINKLPFEKKNKFMKFFTKEKGRNQKKKYSKSQIWDCDIAMKKISHEKNKSNKGLYCNSGLSYDFGKKMDIAIAKKIISPLSKSTNQEKDLNFMLKNNIDASKKTLFPNFLTNEELFS